MNSQRHDYEIIDAVLAGHREDYNELVLRHKDYAYSLALKLVHNSMDAEEIAHDAFIKAFRSLKKFNRKAKFTTWLYRIVFNTAISHKRKNSIEVDAMDEIVEQPISSLNTSDTVLELEREKYLGLAMERLLPLDASLISLFYLQQLNLEEIGEVVGIKASAVKVKLFRARKRLAKELKMMLAGEVYEII